LSNGPDSVIVGAALPGVLMASGRKNRAAVTLLLLLPTGGVPVPVNCSNGALVPVVVTLAPSTTAKNENWLLGVVKTTSAALSSAPFKPRLKLLTSRTTCWGLVMLFAPMVINAFGVLLVRLPPSPASNGPPVVSTPVADWSSWPLVVTVALESASRPPDNDRLAPALIVNIPAPLFVASAWVPPVIDTNGSSEPVT